MTASSLPPLVEVLAARVAGLAWDALPPEIVRMAKRCVLDTLGSALHGTATPEAARPTTFTSRIFLSLAASPSSAPSVPLAIPALAITRSGTPCRRMKSCAAAAIAASSVTSIPWRREIRPSVAPWAA